MMQSAAAAANREEGTPEKRASCDSILCAADAEQQQQQQTESGPGFTNKKQQQQQQAEYEDEMEMESVSSDHEASGNSGVGGVLATVTGPFMMPPTGFYERVSYPVTTLFCPPRAVAWMPPRVQMPSRPGPVYRNDLALAGDRENEAQVTVSRVWRGIMTRRNLRTSRTYDHILNFRASMIQCWWRGLVAGWRCRKLTDLKKQWLASRAALYIAERNQNLSSAMTWQRRRFEGAAVAIQQLVRWYLRVLARERSCEAGEPESEWPAALPCPIEPNTVRYFPWRRTSAELEAAAAAAAFDDVGSGGMFILAAEAGPAGSVAEDGAPAAAPTRRRTLLDFRKERVAVEPPAQSSVELTNAAMRQREADRQAALTDPAALSRMDWKREGLRHNDLDFNAGLIQRLFRSQQSGVTVRTVDISGAYMDKIVRTIARSFRMYVLVHRIIGMRHSKARWIKERTGKYSSEKIAQIEQKRVWGQELLDGAAATIQRCWHWYCYRRYGELPRSVRAEVGRREALAAERDAQVEGRRKTREAEIRRLTMELGVDFPTEAAAAANQSQNDNGNTEDEDVSAAEGSNGDTCFKDLDTPYEAPVPPAPPYHLIDGHLAREMGLRNAMMNLQQRAQQQMAHSHRYVKFRPEKTNVRKGISMCMPKS